MARSPKTLADTPEVTIALGEIDQAKRAFVAMAECVKSQHGSVQKIPTEIKQDMLALQILIRKIESL